MDESILKLITEYAANERLDDIMLGDEEHMAIQKEVDENQERLDGMNLSKEQKMPPCPSDRKPLFLDDINDL